MKSIKEILEHFGVKNHLLEDELEKFLDTKEIDSDIQEIIMQGYEIKELFLKTFLSVQVTPDTTDETLKSIFNNMVLCEKREGLTTTWFLDFKSNHEASRPQVIDGDKVQELARVKYTEWNKSWDGSEEVRQDAAMDQTHRIARHTYLCGYQHGFEEASKQNLIAKLPTEEESRVAMKIALGPETEADGSWQLCYKWIRSYIEGNVK